MPLFSNITSPLLCAALLSTPSLHTNIPPHHHPSQDGWLKKYSVSVTAGAIIGTTTGTICALVDASTYSVLIPCTWYIARSMRKTAVKSIAETFTEDNVRFCKHIIHDSAWLCSWASWCAVMRMLWYS